MRGLVFAETAVGDAAAAAEANRRLIDWLEPRRAAVWQPAAARSLSDVTTDGLQRLRQSGTDTTMALGMSLQTSNMVQQLLGQAQNDQVGEAVRYKALWRAHHELQRGVLLWAGDRQGLMELVQTQAAHAAAPTPDRGRDRRRYIPGPFRTYRQQRSAAQHTFDDDWREAMRKELHRYRHFEPLTEHFDQLGSRVPADQWLRRSEALAATGHTDDAADWQRRAAEVQLARLRAGDSPDVGSGEDLARWSWRWRGQVSRDQSGTVRKALQVALDDDRDDSRAGAGIEGWPDQLWEMALIQPEVETGLLELADGMVPGWGSSKTLEQLVRYYRAKGRPEAIVELLDRVFELEELVQSPRLPEYLRACYEADDNTRLERVLASCRDMSSMLDNDVLLARLMSLRHLQRHDEANQLERDLITRCRVEPVNPFAIERRLRGKTLSTPPRRSRGTRPFTDDLPTAATLAAALGVRYKATVTEDDITLREIREAYRRHGLYAHAGRMLDLELADAGPALTPFQRYELLVAKADLLALADQPGEAKRVAQEGEELLLGEIRNDPTDPRLREELAELYGSRGFGPDRQRQYAALAVAKRLDPAFDRAGRDAGACLYELGRYEEAWQTYKIALDRGMPEYTDASALYRAGLAAHKAGDAEASARLLRQALWRDPLHETASEAREVIHE